LIYLQTSRDTGKADTPHLSSINGAPPTGFPITCWLNFFSGKTTRTYIQTPKTLQTSVIYTSFNLHAI